MRLSDLVADPTITVLDHLDRQRAELAGLLPAPTADELAEPPRWVYYPWRRAVIKVLGPESFARVRFDRNRLKIKTSEQQALRRLRIGVVGLSTGHTIAHALALEGLCGYLRLSDFDDVNLSNLNRIPGTLLDIGLSKVVVVARRIAEIDPYLQVDVDPSGIDATKVDQFVQGLDLVVEQCDSFDMKVSVRVAARRHRVPVFMETNDRGMFDVERFDLEPDRPLFHGLVAGIESAELSDLDLEQRTRYLLEILDPGEMSAGAAATMLELGRTVANWPQLGSETQLAAATVAAAVRRFGLSQPLPSGRIRIDLDAALDGLGDDAVAGPRPLDELREDSPAAHPRDGDDLTSRIPADPADAVVHAARLGPSGGNSQPWLIDAEPGHVRIRLSTVRTSTMDLAHRGGLVAVGAAAFNARVAAAKHHLLGPVTVESESGPPTVRITLSPGEDAALASLYPAMVRRMSNRTVGRRAPISGCLAARLDQAARAEGARLHLVTDSERLDRLAEVLAESDRVRYLTPGLHREMFAELCWPGSDRLDVGIDVHTLGLTAEQLLLLPMLGRPEVMQRLTPEPDLGTALGDLTARRVRSASGLAIVTIDGTTAADYIRGGSAVERVWVTAIDEGLGVYPVSPVFIFATNDAELRALSVEHAKSLGQLQFEMGEIVGFDCQTPALVMRLTHDPDGAVRSQRLPLSEVLNALVVAR